MIYLTDDDIKDMRSLLYGDYLLLSGGVCHCDCDAMCEHRIDYLLHWMKCRSGCNVESMPIFHKISYIKESLNLKRYGEL